MRLFLLLTLLLMGACPALAWDFARHSIPVDEIMSGGPPRDGIPALVSPKYVPAAKASFMRDDEEVLGLALNGTAKAYPLRIMSWHELVNDRIAGLPVLVSW